MLHPNPPTPPFSVPEAIRALRFSLWSFPVPSPTLLIFPRGEKGVLPFGLFCPVHFRFLSVFHLGVEGIGGSQSNCNLGLAMRGRFFGANCFLSLPLWNLGNYIFLSQYFPETQGHKSASPILASPFRTLILPNPELLVPGSPPYHFRAQPVVLFGALGGSSASLP